jgi:hypothetical protein
MTREGIVFAAVFVSLCLLASGFVMGVLLLWAALLSLLILSPLLVLAAPWVVMIGTVAVGAALSAYLPVLWVWWFVGALAVAFAALIVKGQMMARRAK